jgi:hypothetical protein
MTEILLKVALNTITLTLLILFKSSCNFESDIKHHSSNHYQLKKLAHNVVSSTTRLSGIRTHNVSGNRH